MVDAGAAGAASHMRTIAARAACDSPVVEIRSADAAALSDYAAFCRDAVTAPAQHPLWVKNWIEATGADAIVATLHREGRPAVALALEIVQDGPFRTARFTGGSHANGNFPATKRRDAAPFPQALVQTIASAIRSARPDIDLVALQRQNPTLAGLDNPLAAAASMRSPNVSLAVDLSGGFEAMLARRGGKRKRKKFRHQTRKFEEAGGARLIEATTAEEADRLIDAFFAMKAARFGEKGIANVFAPEAIQSFYRQLFRQALETRTPPFLLHGLEVGGLLRAVNGCSVVEDRIVCEFGSICESRTNTSPGFFLDYASIEEACALGKAFYDFSVGDEEYKRSWCDVETWQFDTLLPLSARGRVAWACEMARAQAVRLVKSNDALWSLVKQLRARVAGTKPAQEKGAD